MGKKKKTTHKYLEEKRDVPVPKQKREGCRTLLMIPLSFFYIELFGFFFLSMTKDFSAAQLWPVAFGALWAVLLSGLLRLLAGKKR